VQILDEELEYYILPRYLATLYFSLPGREMGARAVEKALALKYNTTVPDSRATNEKITYQQVLALFGPDLKAIEKAIFDNLASRNQLLQEIMTYIARSGGKRLRPLLVCICAKLGGYEGSDHIALGNVVEYLHAATLLHDDVLDNAFLRRGSPSANSKWGNHFSVLGGDFLYTSAFDILLRSFPRDIIQVLCRASMDMIEGEVLQRQWRSRIDVTEETYFEIISLKTASLIAASCQTGGMLGGVNSEDAQNLADFGKTLGTAFQVIDDTLDYMAEEKKLGKVLGGDLRQGTVTLPLIYLMQTLPPGKEKTAIQGTVATGEIDDDFVMTVRRLLEESGSARKALDTAAAHARRSKEKLLTFGDSPLFPALEAAADYIIHRSH
jgi:octaprenyl-diphosphate synthase